MIVKMRRLMKVGMFVVAFSFVALIVLQWGADISSRVWGQRGHTPDVLTRVGKTRITREEYAEAIQRTLANLENTRQTREISAADMEKVHEETWSALVKDKLWQSFYDREKIGVTDAEVFEIMKSNPPPEYQQLPALQTDGKFDPAKYQAFLADPRSQAFVTAYAQDLKRVIPLEKARWDITSSYRPAGLQIQWISQWASAGAAGTYLYVLSRDVAKPQPTDAELQAYYDKHREDFVQDARRLVRFVVFPRTITASDSARSRQAMADAYNELTAGGDFATIARDFADTFADTTTMQIGALDSTMRAVIDGLRPGQYSSPYLDHRGAVIVKYFGRTPTDVKISYMISSLQPSPETREEDQRRIQEFTAAARKHGFDSTAAQFGLRVGDVPPVTEDRLFFPYVPDQFALEAFIRGSRPGAISDPLRGDNGYYVFQLQRVEKKSLRPFADVKESVRSRYVKDRTTELIAARARELYQQLRQGRTIEELKRADTLLISGTVRDTSFLGIRNQMGDEFAGALFALRPGETAGPISTARGAFLVRCDARTTGKPLTPETLEPIVRGDMSRIMSGITAQIFERSKIEDYRDAFFY